MKMTIAAFSTLLTLAIPVQAAGLLPGEISPTSAMIAKAKKLFPPGYPEITDDVYHFRRVGSYVMVCAYGGAVGGNGGFCEQTTLSEVQKFDQIAADYCEHKPSNDFLPHSVTGEFIFLNYRCAGRHMKRDPYADVFDADGYHVQDWKLLD